MAKKNDTTTTSGANTTTSLETAPTFAAYAAACLATTSAYAPKPAGNVPLALGPAALACDGSNPKAAGSATHARWAAMVAGMKQAQAEGKPYTVAMALATGTTMADIRWGLSPVHKGQQLVVAQ